MIEVEDFPEYPPGIEVDLQLGHLSAPLLKATIVG